MFQDAFAFAHGVLKEQGKYPHTVTLVRNGSAVTDQFGHTTQKPETFAADLPAHVIPTGGNERDDTMQAKPEQTHKVLLDYLDGVTEGTWVVFEGRILHIAAAINVGQRSIELELHCTEER